MTREKIPFQGISGEALEAYMWRPQGEIVGVLQLVHGMAEHILRYDEVAQALARASFLVVGHTQLGHGESAPVKGFFGKSNGVQTLLKDIHVLRTQIQLEWPNVPYFILGHSMGSFLARCYIETYSSGLAGTLLSGTGHYTKQTVNVGITLSRLMIALGQGQKPCALIDRVISMGHLKKVDAPKTMFDWLSRDEAQVQKYVDDPCCGFPFTAYGYRDLFIMLKQLTDGERLKQIPPDLPICLFSGIDDPIGGFGSGVGLVAAELRNAGLINVQVRLYKNGRHEMLNELNSREVFDDMIQWLYNHLA